MAVLVGKEAPDFKEKAAVAGEIKDNFTLSQFRGKKYVVLFFYPLDFTFVCPTEMHAFQEQLGEFESRNTQVIGCSTDSVFSHLAWLNTPKNVGGIQGITYPIISDMNKKVSRAYDVLDEDFGAAYRGVFVIDKNGTVQSQIINNRPIGRNIAEVVRLVDAVQYAEEHGEVCPANWTKGDKAMKATDAGLKTYFGGK